MIDLITEASELQKFIEDKGWEFYFVGGIKGLAFYVIF